MEYLSPKLDIVFKKMFGDANNSDMLRNLVSAYLGIDTNGKFELSNTEITPEELERKFARLDLRISTDTSEIDVEVQVLNAPDYSERSIYYWASLYSSTVKRGEEYGTAKTTMALNILDFKMFNCDNFNTNFTFYDPKNKVTLSDKAQISFIELPKIRTVTKEQIANDERIAWAAFFNAKREEDFNMLNKVTTNPNVQKAVTIIRELSADEKIREEARKREEALYTERSALSSTYDKGVSDGIAKGRAEGVAQVIANMKALGMSETEIKRILNAGKSSEQEHKNQNPTPKRGRR
ncbi:MAG: Rpn family recombination-promoting nuclease/putative transposase [Oscillospiraceae bacterium]|nr:Rpn family recombination-promoting nuclease/putative transposase [Oscillospiraceae bacterium]